MSVGDNTVKYAAHYLSSIARAQFFVFGDWSQLMVELDPFARWRPCNAHKGGDRITYLVTFMARHPSGSYVVLPLLSLWKWPHRK